MSIVLNGKIFSRDQNEFWHACHIWRKISFFCPSITNHRHYLNVLLIIMPCGVCTGWDIAGVFNKIQFKFVWRRPKQLKAYTRRCEFHSPREPRECQVQGHQGQREGRRRPWQCPPGWKRTRRGRKSSARRAPSGDYAGPWQAQSPVSPLRIYWLRESIRSAKPQIFTIQHQMTNIIQSKFDGKKINQQHKCHVLRWSKRPSPPLTFHLQFF